MKIKNISKKIIGNEKFQMLPGGVMAVSGDESWVINYLERKKLEIIVSAATLTPSAEEPPSESEQKNTEVKAEKGTKKAWAAILKKGEPEEIRKLAEELGIATENVSLDDLIEMVKIAIK